jgi:hypothetical protein
MECMVNATPLGYPVPSVQEDWWAAEPVWKNGENLAVNGCRSSDRLGRTESLSRGIWPIYSRPIITAAAVSSSRVVTGFCFALAIRL